MGFKKRLLSLVPGHKPEETDSDAGEQPQDGFGLHLLYDGTKNEAESSLARDGKEDPVCLESVDIIAVHGLGGGAFSTWRHPESGIMWLQDLLPSTMHMSRIMSYGYDAKIYKNRSTLHMMDNAENLLFEIQAARNSKTLQTRRIIFIGHSFGGLVIKKALIMAREEEKYQSLLRSTKGIMFMSTPHNGADAAKLASTIANIANSITTLNTNNLKTLERDSVTLQEISRSFGFLTHFKIVTVIESDKTRIPHTNAYTLIVPRPSARLNLGDRETVLSILGADYHMVCKFRGEDDKQYCNIKSALVTLAATPSASMSTLQHIPYSPDPGFAGRMAILKDLHSAFLMRDKHTRVALYGLGGIGRTSIAIEFAYEYLRLRPHLNVFWVRGATARRFEQSYRLIAEGLKIEGHDDPQADILTLVKEWMIESAVPWLMILDDADDEGQYFRDMGTNLSGPDSSEPRAVRPLSQYIPQTPNGCVLITSGDKKTALQLVGNQPENIINVEELKPENSQILVRTKLSQGNMITLS